MFDRSFWPRFMKFDPQDRINPRNSNLKSKITIFENDCLKTAYWKRWYQQFLKVICWNFVSNLILGQGLWILSLIWRFWIVNASNQGIKWDGMEWTLIKKSKIKKSKKWTFSTSILRHFLKKLTKTYFKFRISYIKSGYKYIYREFSCYLLPLFFQVFFFFGRCIFLLNF